MVILCLNILVSIVLPSFSDLANLVNKFDVRHVVCIVFYGK